MVNYNNEKRNKVIKIITVKFHSYFDYYFIFTGIDMSDNIELTISIGGNSKLIENIKPIYQSDEVPINEIFNKYGQHIQTGVTSYVYSHSIIDKYIK